MTTATTEERGERRVAVQQVLEQATSRGFAPGAVAAVVDEGGDRDVFVAGHRFPVDEGGDVAVVDERVVFDLASLTKLLCTTRLVAQAIDDEALALDEVPFPRWPGVTVAHLLQHTGGLPAHKPFFELAERHGVTGVRAGRDVVVDAVLSTPVETAPGARTVYSDLGFIALGALLEERLGDPLDELFARASSGPGFVRLWRDGFHAAVPHVAATERCPWRRRAMHGQVHDENAYAMGGVAGHAGLFGAVDDVVDSAVFFLRALRDASSTLARFAFAPGERGLGFDKATPGGSTGDALGARAVGHLGFTGTSLWLDIDAGRAYVLLSNTVSPTRSGVLARNKALRRAFHRAAALGEQADLQLP